MGVYLSIRSDENRRTISSQVNKSKQKIAGKCETFLGSFHCLKAELGDMGKCAVTLNEILSG
jgi:hypothetical protein